MQDTNAFCNYIFTLLLTLETSDNKNGTKGNLKLCTYASCKSEKHSVPLLHQSNEHPSQRMEAFEEKYLNPHTDFGFKRLFGTEFNKDLTQGIHLK